MALLFIFGFGSGDNTYEEAVADGHVGKVRLVQFEDNLILFFERRCVVVTGEESSTPRKQGD